MNQALADFERRLEVYQSAVPLYYKQYPTQRHIGIKKAAGLVVSAHGDQCKFFNL